MAYIIAIDGTSGCGKGSTTKLIAQKLNLFNIDTGIIYRTMTLGIIEKGIEPTNQPAIIKEIAKMKIDLVYNNHNQQAFLNDIDVTEEIRKDKVNKNVALISSIIEVRQKATDMIRVIANRALENNISVIAEGRDIGTCVFPDAKVKFYMDASLEERAIRRKNQFLESNQSDISLDQVKQDLANRDKLDKEKPIGALKQAADAIYIDTTTLSLEEVTQKMIDIINQKTL